MDEIKATIPSYRLIHIFDECNIWEELTSIAMAVIIDVGDFINGRGILAGKTSIVARRIHKATL